MPTIGDLTAHNPFMQVENQFFIRNAVLGTPAQRIQSDDPKVTISETDLKIARAVQGALFVLQLSFRFIMSVIIAKKIGMIFYAATAIGTLGGIIIGATLSLEKQEPLPNYFIHQSNLYACYQRKFKIIDPLLEITSWLVACKIELMLIKYNPRLIGSLFTALTAYLYTSSVSQIVTPKVKELLSQAQLYPSEFKHWFLNSLDIHYQTLKANFQRV